MPEPQEPKSPDVPGTAVSPAPGNPAPEPAENSPMQPTPTNLAPATSETGSNTPQRIPFWLQQAERFLRVIVRIYLGLLVCFAPWYPPAWDANPLFSQSPSLLHFITNGAVRGLVSGLGVLNLWIALREAIGPSADSGPR